MGERWIINLVRVFVGGWGGGRGGGGGAGNESERKNGVFFPPLPLSPPLFLSQSSSPLGSLLTRSSPLALPRPRWQQQAIFSAPAPKIRLHCRLQVTGLNSSQLWNRDSRERLKLKTLIFSSRETNLSWQLANHGSTTNLDVFFSCGGLSSRKRNLSNVLRGLHKHWLHIDG